MCNRFTLLFISLCLAGLHLQLAGKELPLETFFRQAQYLSVKLSPDGKSIAVLTPQKGRQNLLVVDLAGRKGNLLTSFEDQDVTNFHWANNQRLLFSTGNLQESWSEARWGGLFGINRDGSDARIFVPTLRQQVDKGQFIYRYASFCCRIDNNDKEVLVAANERNQQQPDVYRMNVYNGKKELLTFDSPGRVVRWWPDRSGTVRLAGTSQDGKWRTYYREGENSSWAMLSEYRLRDEMVTPLTFGPDNKTLYVTSNIGRDKRAVYTYDIPSRKVKELIFAHDQYDIDNLLFDAKDKKLVGVSYEADRPTIHWLDAGWKKMQERIDQALPGRVNLLSRDTGGDNFFIASFSDRHPVAWYLFDAQKNRLEEIASSRPEVNPELMTETKLVSIKSRDGLDLPAFLTLPRESAGKNLPLVVVAPGNIFVRTHWGFNPEVQFLASRGYAVLQPQLRGSNGFGKKFLEAGYKELGGKMVDDLVDATRWAINLGIADKKRVCVYGQTIGGYIALLASIRAPDLYRCAISYGGLTNADLIITTLRKINALDFTETDLKEMIGDPVKDKELFRRTSPLENAGKINAAVLLAYGGEDHLVPNEQSTALRRALERADKPVEWLYKSDEGHIFGKPNNRIEFYSRMENFLKKHLL